MLGASNPVHNYFRKFFPLTVAVQIPGPHHGNKALASQYFGTMCDTSHVAFSHNSSQFVFSCNTLAGRESKSAWPSPVLLKSKNIPGSIQLLLYNLLYVS